MKTTQEILWEIDDAIFKLEDDDKLDKRELEMAEDDYYKNRQKFSIKELADIFPEAQEVIMEQIVEVIKDLHNALLKIESSVEHYIKDPQAKPICLATIEIINEEELNPLERRLRKLNYDYYSLTRKDEKKEIDIEDLKNRIDLRELVQRYGIKVGKMLKTCTVSCPFHKDLKPSMRVSERLFYCHSCSKTGDIITFVMEIENCDFKTAITKL